MAANRPQGPGVPHGGSALLSGLLECGRCGQRMQTHYVAHGRFLRYECNRGHISYGQARCQSLSGRALDRLVGGLILEALAPAAVEASVQLAEDLELDAWRCTGNGASAWSAPATRSSGPVGNTTRSSRRTAVLCSSRHQRAACKVPSGMRTHNPIFSRGYGLWPNRMSSLP